MNETPHGFDVNLERHGDVVLLRFHGELDLDARETATRALTRAVSGAPSVVIDLKPLGFMDSTGIACLLRAKAVADELGTRVAILNGSGPPHRVLLLTGLGEVFEMVDGLDELDPPIPIPDSG